MIIRFRWAAFPVLERCRKFSQQSDLLISFGARLTEFDTGRFGLQLPPEHIQVVEDPSYAGDRIPSSKMVGKIAEIAQAFAQERNEAYSLVRYRRDQSERIKTPGSTWTG